MEAEGFADNPLDPITLYRAAGLCRNADAQTAVRQLISKKDECKTAATQPPALSIHQIILSSFSKKTGLRKGELLHLDQADSRFRPLARRRRMTA